ncbi:hypothetical protein [Vallitalea guaymasensis]|uniref:hypothetical protein n=1 Tax=Vallitalea guaymasensis TaxID=1185412 RepID=UPI002357DF08|nr:hypothetical protein [Vallitalea guaymasensis]
MNRKIKILIICIFIVVIGIYMLCLFNKQIPFNEVINDERYVECYLTKYDPEIASVLITSKKEIKNIFDNLVNKKVKRLIMHNKTDYKTYYSIATKDNWILIYDNKYIELTSGQKTMWFEFISSINHYDLEKYFVNN